jgi:hypothetical protein
VQELERGRLDAVTIAQRRCDRGIGQGRSVKQRASHPLRGNEGVNLMIGELTFGPSVRQNEVMGWAFGSRGRLRGMASPRIEPCMSSRAASTRSTHRSHGRGGVPLEVLAVELAGGELLVIHVMRLRRKYERDYEMVMAWRRRS